jgi:hypothetical protein
VICVMEKVCQTIWEKVGWRQLQSTRSEISEA